MGVIVGLYYKLDNKMIDLRNNSLALCRDSTGCLSDIACYLSVITIQVPEYTSMWKPLIANKKKSVRKVGKTGAQKNNLCLCKHLTILYM